jgi:lysophospholipase L1-like esterase
VQKTIIGIWGLGAALAFTACGADDGGTGPGGGGQGAGATGGSGHQGGSDGAGAVTSTGGVGGSVATGGAGGSVSTGGTGGSVSTGGMGGSVSTGGMGGSGGVIDDPRVPPCLGAGSEGVIIGDSYVTGFISPALQPVLATLHPYATGYRNYAVAGSSMASGGIAGFVPDQFTQAVAADPNMKFLITDGGGNDILICDSGQFPNCNTLCSQAGSSTQAVCQEIVALALSTAESMMDTIAAAGIEDIIYFFYPHIPAAGGGGAGYDEILDYAEPQAKALCESAEARTGGALRCHYVSLIQPFIDAGGDKNPANFVGDGIHPSQAGQEIIAAEIYKVIEGECIGHDSTSTCCE